MSTERFQTTIRAFQRRTPFKPYVVEVVSGQRIQVEHPEALVVRAGVGVFVDVSGAPTVFDHEGVIRISDESVVA